MSFPSEPMPMGTRWRPEPGAVVGIRGTVRAEGLHRVWPSLVEGLAAWGLRFQVARELATRARMSDAELRDSIALRPETSVDEGADLVLSLGGDGSLLAAVGDLRRDIPVLGLHMGSMGYLTAATPEDLPGCLEELGGRGLMVERRLMLRAVVEGGSPGERLCADALNDVVITSGLPGRVVRLVTRLDDETLFMMTGDGLIHATPTGSTAYNLGGGGPILDPAMEAIVLTPVMPHSVSVRPIVLSPGARIETEVRSRHGRMLLSVDGRMNRPLAEGATVRVERSPRVARLLKRSRPGFVGVLRAKLKWNQED